MFTRLFGRNRSSAAVASVPVRPMSNGAPHRGLADVVAADRLAVVDTETTGLYSSDRIIEVAVVTFDLGGEVVDEWDTLVNADRDVGPTWLHGISPSMLIDAPTFQEIAGALASRMHGAVIVAHNLPFDVRLLTAEYSRMGVAFDVAAGIDTLRLTRCNLGVACQQHGVVQRTAHRALNDARATGELLFRLVESIEGGRLPARIISGLPSSGSDRRCPRQGDESHASAAPTWLAGLAAALTHDSAEVDIVNYLDVLNLAMADLHLDIDELNELSRLASEFGLGEAQVAHAHRQWFDDLMAEAMVDGAVDAAEYDSLCRAAAVLGVDQTHVDKRTGHHRTGTVEVILANCAVCFTGEPVDDAGEAIPRTVLEEHARRIGLTTVDSVTKSGCQLLVAADPASMSGKAAKARKFGIPVVSAESFLSANRSQTLEGRAVVVGSVETLVCSTCGRAWTQPRARRPKSSLCPACEARFPLAGSVAPAFSAGSASRPTDARTPVMGVIEVLRCSDCDRDFERARTRGRKPLRCPTCS